MAGCVDAEEVVGIDVRVVRLRATLGDEGGGSDPSRACARRGARAGPVEPCFEREGRRVELVGIRIGLSEPYVLVRPVEGQRVVGRGSLRPADEQRARAERDRADEIPPSAPVRSRAPSSVPQISDCRPPQTAPPCVDRDYTALAANVNGW